MKIKVDYGNKASISTGVPYENISPLYHLSVEIDLPDGTPEDVIAETRVVELKKLKDIVDNMILKDLRDFQHIRSKCNCKPVYIQGRLEHNENCLMGTKTRNA